MKKEEVLRKWNNGFADWKRFCLLMEKYPNESYTSLQIRMATDELC